MYMYTYRYAENMFSFDNSAWNISLSVYVSFYKYMYMYLLLHNSSE